MRDTAAAPQDEYPRPPRGTERLEQRLKLAAGLGLVLLSRLALRLRLRRRLDGWRRGTGLLLRGEAATFVLSAFGLRASRPGEPWSAAPSVMQARVADRLHEFLAREPGVHVRIRRGEHEDRPAAAAGPSYTLGFETWVAGPGRFVRPDTWAGVPHGLEKENAGDALLNIVCRMNRDEADVWVRVNHVGADGVPMQEIMTRLESAWGAAQPVSYPSPAQFEPHRGPRPCRGRDDLVEMQTFLDFGPLLCWRQRENARLPAPMTVMAALIWRLALHPRFSGLYIGSTVEVQAGELPRGVGVVVVRPSDYFRKPRGLPRYVRDFNRNIERTRRRASGGCRTLDASAALPARLAGMLLRFALQQGRGAFGSMALTMQKDAKVFGTPIGDVGHTDGFLALGSLSLPAADGAVGCVTIKGPRAKIADYPELLQEALQELASP